MNTIDALIRTKNIERTRLLLSLREARKSWHNSVAVLADAKHRHADAQAYLRGLMSDSEELSVQRLAAASVQHQVTDAAVSTAARRHQADHERVAAAEHAVVVIEKLLEKLAERRAALASVAAQTALKQDWDQLDDWMLSRPLHNSFDSLMGPAGQAHE